MPKLKNAAQSTLEYIVIIGILVAVLMVIGYYYKRSLQGKYKQAADVFGSGEQYQPGVTNVQ